MKLTLAVLALFASAVFLQCQDKPSAEKTEAPKTAEAKASPSKNPVTETVRDISARQQKNLIAAVEEMPADKFGYSPTPAQMTFGHLVLHMMMSNIELCSKSAHMP